MPELKASELKRYTKSDVRGLWSALEGENGGSEGSVLVGQERAVSALRLGLLMKEVGYNIYVCGQPGSGRTSLALRIARERAAKENTPCDMCYAYNFGDPKSPLLIKMKAGNAKKFSADLDGLIEELSRKVDLALSGKEFDEQRSNILRSFQDEKEDLIRAITEIAKKKNFGVKTTSSGVFFMPTVGDEPMSDEQFQALTDAERKDLTALSEEIQSGAAETVYKIKELDNESIEAVTDLEYRTALFVSGKLFEEIKVKYEDEPEILSFLSMLREDVLEHISDFGGGEEEEESAMPGILPWAVKRSAESPLSKYKINVFVDNSEQNGAPVIVSHEPNYTNLAGQTEYDNEYGNLVTDHMKIRAGLLHKANGGYIVLQEDDVFGSYASWSLLKKTLKTSEVSIEPLREFMTGLAISGMRVKAVSVDVKLIIVGSHYFYGLLSELDADFKKLFKVCAAFDSEIKYGEDSLRGLLGFMAGVIKDRSLRTFGYEAAAAVVEYALRLNSSKKGFSSVFNKIRDALLLASALCQDAGLETVGRTEVLEALKLENWRNGLLDEKISDMINSELIMISTEGSRVGQINALSVMDTGDIMVGKPSRVTATTYLGKAGIINIEKEAEISGSIHNKGVEVISGYLGQMYAQDFPLSLSGRICFEQNYGGIDGDSASGAELFVILSSLSGLPIRQDLAVTGSVNQHGEIQAIGGANEKIEGFFDLCVSRGLSGTQGVILPIQNVQDLMLKDEVIEAVKEKRFHLYSVTTVDEAMKILTGKNFGQRNERGKFPSASVNALVMKKLKSYHEKSLDE